MILGGLGLLLFFWVIIRPLVGAVVRASAPPQTLMDELGGEDSLDGLLPDSFAGLSDEELKQRQATRNLSDRLRSMVDNYESVQSDDLNRLVDLERESTAQVIRRWIRKD